MIKKCSLAMYPRKLWVCTVNDREELLKKFVDPDDQPLDEDLLEEAFDAITIPVMEDSTADLGYLVCIKNKINTGTIAHEAYHAAQNIFNEIGAEVHPENQEPFAYLLGYIAQCIGEYQGEN